MSPFDRDPLALRLVGPAVSALLAFAVVAAPPPVAAAGCATQPPPAGIEPRCLSRAFSFGETMDESARRAVLTIGLSEWMESCFPGRQGLVYASEEGEASLDHIVELVKDLPGAHPGVQVVADYTPRKTTQGGRTCYEVDSVAFHVRGAQGTVDLDGDIEITRGSPPELIKEAATAAKKALRDPSVRGSAELSRFLGVLEALERSGGQDFDDTWYNVQPYPTGGLTLSTVPPACFSDFEAGRGYVCRPADEALKSCERHLAEELVEAYDFGKTSPPRYAVILQSKANDIQRSLDYVHQVHGVEGGEEAACSSISTVFKPRIVALAGRYSVYGAGQY